MKLADLALLGGVALCASVGCTSSPPAGEGPQQAAAPVSTAPAQQPQQSGSVEMQTSFKIAKEDVGGETLTHVPAVAFSADGKRMLTVTSGGHLLTFDGAEHRKIGAAKFDGEQVRTVAVIPDKIAIAAFDDA